jgi:hypothetical protein
MTNGSTPQPGGLDPQTLQLLGVQQPQGFMGQVGKIIGSPLTQAALAGYFGFAGAPRAGGFGRAIGSAGLDALNQFSRASQLQAQQPLLRAKTLSTIEDIPLKAAQIKGQQARGALYQAEAGQYIAEPQLADQLEVLAQNEKDPVMSSTYRVVAEGLRSGMKASDAGRILSTTAVSGSRVALNQANAALAQLKGQTEAMRPGLIQAQTQHAQAGTTAEEAAAAHSMAETSYAGTGSPVVIHNLANPSQTMEMPTRKGQPFTPPPGWEIGAGEKAPSPATTTTKAKPVDPTLEAGRGQAVLKNLRANYDATLVPGAKYIRGNRDFYKYAMSRGINPKTGLKLPALDKGWRYGEPLNDGTPTAIDPTGKRHGWED